jgi:ATP-dependent helicase HrpB
VAARIADDQGWTLGEDVGWHVRFDRHASSRTRLLVVTEGILTARLQADPLLTGIRTVVIDEFHERSLHADLALALSKQAWRAREDLQIVVMSATLAVAPISAFLDECPVIAVPGRTFPVDVTYEPSARPSAAALRLASDGAGDVLCFMPGAAEIRRTVTEIEAASSARAIEVVPLHGGLDSAQQDRAIRLSPHGATRIIVSTNIAETSLTVPGVRNVVDSGWQKVARYDPSRGIDTLVTERITQDAADQRAGRAGRVASGRVVRLWDARDRLRPRREPDVHRVDLAGTALDILAWGGHPQTFEWFEAPDSARLAAALTLLERLGASEDGRLTTMGRRMHGLPLHPRLSRMLVEARGHPMVARACALLSERSTAFWPRHATTSDLLSALDAWSSSPLPVKDVARQIERLSADLGESGARDPLSDHVFRRIVLAGYPDRVARRRDAASNRFKLASGPGAVLSADSGVVDAEFVVALEVRSTESSGATRRPPADADGGTIAMASRVEPDWLRPTDVRTEVWFDDDAGHVRAAAIERYGELTLSERSVSTDAGAAAGVLADAWRRRGPSQDDTRLLSRLKFAEMDVDVDALVRVAAYGCRALADIQIATALDVETRRRLDREAPERLHVPSGRSVPLEYAEDGSVTAAVKLQELFGLADSPRIGPRGRAVVLALLAPNGRPVQVTQDLRSFWNKTYAEVRKELRGRYPKHPWPEDPWHAEPTARTSRRAR